MLDQRVRGEADVLPGAVMLLGAMVGGRPDTVSLLCLDVQESRQPGGADGRVAKLLAVDPTPGPDVR